MSTDVGSRYVAPETLAAGGKANLKKRIGTPDIFPKSKRPKPNPVKEAIRGVTNNTEAFMTPVAPNIRSGTAKQLMRQLGAMNGDIPSLAYAHIPIYTINPRFRPSKFIRQTAETGELTLAFLFSSRQTSSPYTTGGGLKLINWQLAVLRLDRNKFLKEGFEGTASDARLEHLDDPQNIADLCGLLGPVYVNDHLSPKEFNAKPQSSTDHVVQVYGLAEGDSMKDMWPEAPINSQLFLELREVSFNSKTCFRFEKINVKLDASVFVDDTQTKKAYQIVPTFIPPNFDDYRTNYMTKDAYAKPTNFKVPVGRLVFRASSKLQAHSNPAELSRGLGWDNCTPIKVILSQHAYWMKPIVGGGAAGGLGRKTRDSEDDYSSGDESGDDSSVDEDSDGDLDSVFQ
jgi:hypothetical protein